MKRKEAIAIVNKLMGRAREFPTDAVIRSRSPESMRYGVGWYRTHWHGRTQWHWHAYGPTWEQAIAKLQQALTENPGLIYHGE